MKKINKIIIRFKINLVLIVLLFSLSYYLYYISLEKCFSGIDVCSVQVYWIYKKIAQLSISCIISSILFLLIISKIISKLHIFHFCVFFIFFYKISHGNSFEDHGAFNLIAFFLVFFLIIINGLIIKAFFSLFIIVKRKHKIKKFSILTILILFYSNLFNPMECSDWGKGLNNTFIENDIKKYKCNIIFPKRCPYHIFKYFLDFTKLSSLDCSKSKIDNKKLILRKSKSKYINKNTKKFGFPLTNKDLIGRLDGKDDHLLKSFVLNNLQ